MKENGQRYSRQVLFPPIGIEGQKKLLNSRAVIVGMGALGTVIAGHLIRSGVGFVRMIDRDLVELSNLQRQTLFDEEDAANHLPKVIAAKKKLEKINSTITIEAIIADLNLDNAEDLLVDFDVIVDGTDNFLTRYLMNDVAVKYGIPWVHGAAVSSRGMFSVIVPGKTPCYRCLFPNVPVGLGETCDTVGVLSPLTDIIGSFQSMEALKLLVGAETNPNLEQIDIWYNSNLQMDVTDGRDQECPTCVHHQFDFLDRSSHHQVVFSTLCGRNTVQINPRNGYELNMSETAQRLKKNGKVIGNPYLLRFFPDNEITMVLFKDGRVLVHGTNDTVKAKSYYAKYIGT
ncbi:ThiF family adenylyltransferase [Bacillus sp. V3B]|uniref:ThiF family adenylyltransferase n=1 Tax=Bacillus sp. V3B TaxID=2804915 RepID=UPI00210BABAB|nr:ThiF family adenylyltransferase [Bacillus sp. V3B]MCQ6274307.1 ThiF family adenylyltransferase [Bacillus sp. V3B]